MTSTGYGTEPQVPNGSSALGHRGDGGLRESYVRRRIVINKLMSLDEHEMQRERTLRRVLMAGTLLSLAVLASVTVVVYSSGALTGVSIVSALALALSASATLLTLISTGRANSSIYETAAATFQEELTQAWDDVDAARDELARLRQPTQSADNSTESRRDEHR